MASWQRSSSSCDETGYCCVGSSQTLSKRTERIGKHCSCRAGSFHDCSAQILCFCPGTIDCRGRCIRVPPELCEQRLTSPSSDRDRDIRVCSKRTLVRCSSEGYQRVRRPMLRSARFGRKQLAAGWPNGHDP